MNPIIVRCVYLRSITLETAKSEIQHLIANGYDVNKDFNRMVLCSNNDGVEIIQFLLECKADPNTRGDISIKTVLMDAVEFKHSDLVLQLLQCKAEPNLIFSHGVEQWTALDYALDSNDPSIQQIILDAGGKLSGKVKHDPQILQMLNSKYQSRYIILWDIFGNDVGKLIFQYVDSLNL